MPVTMVTETDRDTMIPLLRGFGSHHATGGNLRSASDGMTVQPRGYREAALEVMRIDGWGNSAEYMEMISWLSQAILRALNATGPMDGFPGFSEPNHQPGRFAGPLKSDWGEPCPLDFTAEQLRDQCMSVQETFWGTSNLKRLEEIKKRLDPKNLFTVHFGVGNSDVIDYYG